MNIRPQWHFIGNAPENYERYLVPSIFGPWARDLVEAAALRPGERVLDIACGTGIVARTAARRLGRGGGVVGLDLSAPMLEAARSAASEEGLSVEWREGSAVELPLTDGAFDVVFCQQGLQFFPDRAAAALMTSGPFGLSDVEELRTLISARFSDIAIRTVAKVLRFPSPDQFVLRYVAGSALASSVAKVDDAARAALLAEVRARLQSYVDDQGLSFPIVSNIAIARR